MLDLSPDIGPALEYARAHDLHALAVARGNELLVREFASGFGDETPHPIYSGTKSFWGIAALYACKDGLLTLDEPVAATIPAWRDDPRKRAVTIAMLLDLTAGFGFGGLGASVPSYDRALATPLRNEPGTHFTYGGIALQVFGAVLARKLANAARTPHQYLHERVLDRAGVHVANWRTLSDGTHPLPTGASLRVKDWLAYGRFVLDHRTELARCFVGSDVNPRYGLAWWLGVRSAPADLCYASGSGGQALYIVPSLDLCIVHFSRSSSYRHEVFLRRLFK